MNKLIWGIGTVVIGIFLLSALSCAQQRTEGEMAADFTLTTLEGGTIALPGDAGAQVTIIDFFATWCPPCRMEIPHFVDLYASYKDRGVQVIGISVDGSEDVLRKFVADYGITYPVAIDTAGVGNVYGPIRSIPTTFVLDKNRRIVRQYIGYRDKNVFEADIVELMKE